MLTFFRRIRKGLIDSSQARKYLVYAAGEVLLVMVGILLALQVNNWNENSKIRILEKNLLREINDEFKSNLAEFEGNLEQYKVVRRNLNTIINSFPIDLKHTDLDTLAEVFRKINFKGNYDRSISAITKLKSAGSFDIISNDELKSLLIEWEVMDADYLYDEKRLLLFHEEQFAPMMFKKFSPPYTDGLKDDRIDLDFLQSLEFEGIMKLKYERVNNLFRSMRTELNLTTVMKRIIELSEND